MDLSQQELPLTAYFTKGRKEARSRAVPCGGEKRTEDSQSAARHAKRRSNVRCTTASPLGSSAGQSKPRPETLQLPTPATSTRKRKRGGRPKELPGKTQLTSTGASSSAVEQNPILSSEKGLGQLEFGFTPSKLIQSSRNGAEDAVPESPLTPLAMLSTGRRKTTKPIDIEFPPGPRRSNHTEIGIVTPRTSSRRVAEPVHGIDDHSPLARSYCPLPSEPCQVSPRLPPPGVSHAVLPHIQLLARPTTALPCSPADSGCSVPFHGCEKNSVLVLQDGASAPPKQYFIQPETLDGQPYDGHVIPMVPVASSQSQYLLHLDATPKRKRCSRNVEHVISSQTQEERELTLSMSIKPATAVGLSVGVSPGKHALCGNAQIPRLRGSERESQHVYTLGFNPVGSPINSSAGPSRPFFAMKKALDELSPKSLNSLRRKRLTSCHSPSCKTKTLQGSAPHDSTENIPSAHTEDSLTEPESEPGIIQILRHSPVPRDACPPVRRGFAQGNLSEDDSATEAESDTEILHCVAEIGKQQPRGHCSEVSREDTPPVISPLVSPTRPRIAAVPSTVQFTQSSMREGAGLGAPGLCASYPSTVGLPQHSESLPSVVRDFIRMFPGDESYPADFPESLRI